MATLRATYSKTSVTPCPVFADVKNSFGRCSGCGGRLNEVEGDGPDAGVVDMLYAFSRWKRLGVIVGPEETVEEEGCRRGARVGE